MNLYAVVLPITNDLPGLTVVELLVEATDTGQAIIVATCTAMERGYEIDSNRAVEVSQQS